MAFGLPNAGREEEAMKTAAQFVIPAMDHGKEKRCEQWLAEDRD
jgi:hypothetical protein